MSEEQQQQRTYNTRTRAGKKITKPQKQGFVTYDDDGDDISSLSGGESDSTFSIETDRSCAGSDCEMQGDDLSSDSEDEMQVKRHNRKKYIKKGLSEEEIAKREAEEEAQIKLDDMLVDADEADEADEASESGGDVIGSDDDDDDEEEEEEEEYGDDGDED